MGVGAFELLPSARPGGAVLPGSRGGEDPRPPGATRSLPEKIREVLAASPFYGEGHRKVWARLRFAGVRTSKARVLRLMREAQLLAPSRTVPVAENPHTGTIITERPNEVWATDHALRSPSRRPGGGVRRGRSLHDRMRGHPCSQKSHAIRGAGTTPASGA